MKYCNYIVQQICALVYKPQVAFAHFLVAEKLFGQRLANPARIFSTAWERYAPAARR